MAGISQARRDDSTSAGLACDDLAAGTAKAACRTMVEGFRVLAEFISWANIWNGRVHKRRSHPYTRRDAVMGDARRIRYSSRVQGAAHAAGPI